MTVPIPEYAGCPWPADPACLTDEWAMLDASVRDRSLALASATLNRLTGYRVTNCPITVRPSVSGACFVPYTGFEPSRAFMPGIDLSGRWVNNCGPACSNPRIAVRLPRPVGRVDEVKVDGVVVDPANYQIMDGNMLVYTGTGDGWPVTQDVMIPDTEVGSFSITYLNGYPPDATAAYAVALLAMEFAKACTGSKGCRLPTGVTAIVRQGVQMEIDSSLFPKGTTGIREVDVFIGLWNPHNQQPSRIIIPGAR